MTHISWKKVSPNSLRQGMEWSLEHARTKRNLSVDRVADGMGLANRWTLYKWMTNSRMPMVLIRPFEDTCGIDLITRYLCYSNHKLMIDIPKGRKVTAHDLHELQGSFAEVISLLVQFYEGSQYTEDTLNALSKLMEELAWQKGNVEKHLLPELGL